MNVIVIHTAVVLLIFVIVCGCVKLNENLLDNLMGQNPWFDDADFDLSRNKLLLKELKSKRFDDDEFSYGGGSDSSISSSTADIDTDPWPGRWLPEKVEPSHRVVSKRLNDSMHPNHAILMTSSINRDCDDGKTNLTVDWSGSPENYTCFRRTFFTPDMDIPPHIFRDYIPTEYHARHICMRDQIHYSSSLPTFGPHRPAWARYGEYTFLPIQRWLHNLEHGAIVMLYHPCANPLLVSKLRDIVTSCLYRHIVTPYTLLPETRPLALVSWGWAMTMSDVNQNYVEKFIRDHALHGPELLSKDGDYSYLLKKPAEIITTADDQIVCPYSVQHHM